MKKDKWFEKVKETCQSLGVIDTHDHIWGRKQRLERNPNLLDILGDSYLYFDLLSSGMPPDIFDPKKSEEVRWKDVKPYLPMVTNTPYYRLLIMSFHELFDFTGDTIQDKNWRTLSSQIQQATQNYDWFDYVLGKKMGLDKVLLDWHVGGTEMHFVTLKDQTVDWYDYILKVRPKTNTAMVNNLTRQRNIDTRYFCPVIKVDPIFHGYLKECHGELETLFGVPLDSVNSLKEYEQWINLCLRKAQQRKAVALKVCVADFRSLYFPESSSQKAEKVFSKPLNKLTRDDVWNFENYIMHYLLKKSIIYHFPVQIHTGTLVGGNNRNENTRTDLLFNLLVQYPEVKFNLLHGGYPYLEETGALAKRFPNVFIDLSWLTMLSSGSCRQILSSWLENLPINKLVWGGDCYYVEETFGAYLFAQKLVGEVLWEKIQNGYFNIEFSQEIVKRIFRENALQIFDLGNKKK